MTSAERKGAPTPYRARVWEIHRRLWPFTDGLPFPELERMVLDLFPGFRAPRSALAAIVRREPSFSTSTWKVTRSVVLATGCDVPDDCRPGGAAPAVATPQRVGDDDDGWPDS